MRFTEFPGERKQVMSTIIEISKRNQRIRKYIHGEYMEHPQNTKFNRESSVSMKQNKFFNIYIYCSEINCRARAVKARET